MSSVQAEPMITLETAAAGEICPHCDSLKETVMFKVWLEEGDTYICEDCFDKMEKEEEEQEEEEDEEEEGQDCRGCGCWLPDGEECVFPESCDAFCEPCFEERQEEEMYGVLLQGDDLVFTENGKTVNTLKAVPCAEASYRWFTALLSTNIDAFKKERDLLIKAQEFEEEWCEEHEQVMWKNGLKCSGCLEGEEEEEED
jgi:hypothetical protein